VPRRVTDKILDRKEDIAKLLEKYGELPTNEIMRITGLTHSQVFYVLKLLEREGLVQEIKRGKIAYWRLVKQPEQQSSA